VQSEWLDLRLCPSSLRIPDTNSGTRLAHASAALQCRFLRGFVRDTGGVSAWRSVPHSTWAMRDEHLRRLRVRAGGPDSVGHTDAPMQYGAMWWGLHDFIPVRGWPAVPRRFGAVRAMRTHIERGL
jgi:hypothetical protein